MYIRDFAGVQQKKGHMKKNISLRFAVTVLGLATAASLVGSISGTIAWYAFSTRALVSYTGTSVQSTTQLQIGIKSDIPINFTTNASLIEDVTFPEDLYYDDVNDPYHLTKLYHNHYYFMRVGSGGMPAAIINDYLSAKGYATNVLEPLSSYAYNTGENINLRNRPITNNPSAEKTTAETTKYVKIPFVFRVLASNTESLTYVEGHDIFLSNAQAIAAPNLEGNTDGNVIYNSIRLYIDRSNGDNFILNPSSPTDGRDKVAGVLNLTGGAAGSGFYDYDNNPSSPTYMQEYLYGDYEWKEGKNWENSLSTPLSQDSDLVDVNGTGNSSIETTFTSRHRKDVKYFGDLDSCIIPHYANYLGTSTVYPQKVQGQFVGNYAVCRTGDEDHHYLGLFDMMIYLEGWDHSVVDSQLQNKFYLGLTFEINIVSQEAYE